MDLFNSRDFPITRLSIDLTDQQHQSPKAIAALEGKAIREYAIERLFLADTGGDQARQVIEALLGKRISGSLAGKVLAKSIGTVTAEELESRT